MSEFKARIGRIRMKNGGADVRVLQRSTEVPDRRGELMKHSRVIVEASEDSDPLVGHIVVGFFASGKSSVGIYHDPETCRIPRALMPAWIEELVRRDLVTDAECREIFDQKFEWRDGPTG